MKNPAISTLLFRAFKQIKTEFEAGKSSLSLIEQSQLINEMKALLADNLVCSDFKFLCNTHDFLRNHYLILTKSIHPEAINDPNLGELIHLLSTECWDYLAQNATQNKKNLEMIIVVLVQFTSIYVAALIEIAQHAISDTELYYEKIERCIRDFFDRSKHYSLNKTDIYTLESYRYVSIYQRATLEGFKGNVESARLLINQCLSFTECYSDYLPDDTFKNGCLELSALLPSEVILVEKIKKKRSKHKSHKSLVATPQIATIDVLIHRHQDYLKELEHRLSSMDLHECHAMCEQIKESLAACVTSKHLNHGLDQFSETMAFISQYVFSSLESYSGIKEHLSGISLSPSILSELATIIIDAGWISFSKLDNELPSLPITGMAGLDNGANLINAHLNMDDLSPLDILSAQTRILVNILSCTLYYSRINLYGALIQLKKFGSLDSDLNQLVLDVNAYVMKSDDSLEQFNVRLSSNNPLTDEMTYNFKKMKSIGALLKADVEIKKRSWTSAMRFMSMFELFKTQYADFIAKDEDDLWFEYYDVTIKAMSDLAVEDLLATENEQKINLKPQPAQSKIQKASNIKKVETPVITLINNVINPSEKAFFEIKRAPYSERLKEAKKNKKNEKINALFLDTQRLPICHNPANPLSVHLNEVSRIIKMSSCEAYMYGSGNIKENPGDFDILIPGIYTPEDMKKVDELIDLFEKFGGISKRDKTGMRGYTKDERYIIPVKWAQFKIDFNISNQSHFTKHALTTDFTIGALYFDFRRHTTYQLHSIQAWKDFDSRTLNTLSDSTHCFKEDPIRILRGIRWIAEEGFHFSEACESAVKCIFSEEENIFAKVPPGKFYYHSQLLLSSPFLENHIAELERLGGLTQFYNVLDITSKERLEPFLHAIHMDALNNACKNYAT